MKYQKSLFFLTLVLGICCFSCKKDHISVPTDEEILGSMVKPREIDEYIYPIRPGTPEWATLGSHEEMETAVQIPDSVLDKITTWGLVESCINYPLYGDCAAYNDQVGYINDLMLRNRGLKELVTREDAPKIMLYYYRHWDVGSYPDFVKRNFIELIIGSDSFLSKLNERQLLYLTLIALQIKDKEKENYTSSLPPYSFFVMANAMIHYPYKPFADYCAVKKDPLPDGFIFWRINASSEKIEEYSRRLLF
ncbi:MAG: hypothetical protein HXX13_17685 [Bacteroidetes bacterium]|nr:hypothetical protein [Bacteroidota bacterium]